MRCGLYVCLCISVITLNNCVHTSALSTALPCSSLRIWKRSISTVLSMQKPNFLQQLSSKSLWARRIDYYQRLVWLHIQREPTRWKAAGTYCSFGADLRSKCIICASDAGYFLTFSPIRTGAFTVNFPNPLDPWRNADILILFQVPSGKRTLTYERVSTESRRADSRDITRDGAALLRNRRTDDELQTTEDPELRCCQKLSCCCKNETSRNLFGSLQTQSRHLGRSSALLRTSCHDSNKCVETTLSSAVAPCKLIS